MSILINIRKITEAAFPPRPEGRGFHTEKLMKKLFIALCASFIGAVFLFAGTAYNAQANPNFVKWTWSWSRQANNNFPADDTRHANLKVVIKYTNVSNNRIITAFFKKSLQIQGLTFL